MRKVHRSDLKNANYNPRTIDKHAARKLRENIKKTGLIQPIIWNESTGNIVGGHQRIAAIDALESSPDYWLDVAVVALTEKQEKQQNVFLNNIAAQGTWDLDGLGEMFKSGDLDIEGSGFDLTDIQLMFDDPDLSGLATEADPAAKEIETVESIRKRKKDWKDKQDVKNDPNFQVVLVFNDSAEVDEFLMSLDLPIDQKFVDGRRIARMIDSDNSRKLV